jgi:hypothetical protein
VSLARRSTSVSMSTKDNISVAYAPKDRGADVVSLGTIGTAATTRISRGKSSHRTRRLIRLRKSLYQNILSGSPGIVQ